MHYNYVSSQLTGFTQNSDVSANFGEKISEASAPVVIYRGTSRETIRIPLEKILAVDEVLVFIGNK